MFSKIKYKDITGKTHHADPDSFVTQTILFDQDVFTPEQAIEYLKRNGKSTGLDIKKELKSGEKSVIRARQVSPTKFKQLHTKEIEKGIQIVGGNLKP